MTGEERWRRAFEDEQAAPTEWEPDTLALRTRMWDRSAQRNWWAVEVALVLESRKAGVSSYTRRTRMIDADIAVDFMDMTSDRRLWARPADMRPDFSPHAGQYAVVGDDDADPAVARILSVDDDGNVELEVLEGTVDSHRDLLAPR